MVICINNTSFLAIHCKWAAFRSLLLALAVNLHQTSIIGSSGRSDKCKIKNFNMPLLHRDDRCKFPTPGEVILSFLYNDIGYVNEILQMVMHRK